MADFLTVCGLTIPIRDGQADDAIESEGQEERAFNGDRISMRRYTKHSYSLRSTILEQTRAVALMHLLNGEGHYWTFNNSTWQYSSKGLDKLSGTAVQAGGGKFGGKIRITTSQVVWRALAPTAFRWTVMLWQKLDSAGTYDHVVVRDDGAKWSNGVRNDLLPTPFLSVAGNGNVSVGDPLTTRDIDDLVILPFRLSDDMPPVFGVATSAFGIDSTLPSLPCRGELFEPNTNLMHCFGTDIKSKLVQYNDAGTWKMAGRELSFSLDEA